MEFPVAPVVEVHIDTEVQEPPIIVTNSSKYSKIEGKENTSYESCVVCIEEYEENDNILILEKCNHMFHKKCLLEWMSSSGNVSCPMCNT